MTNDNKIRPPTPEEREAWLTEYQACQQYNSERSTSYWTLTGIFIGFSSVLLGALIYAFSSNKHSCLLGIITMVISTAVLVILYFLKRWLKRISFLQQINFERMRDIERDLGMWASWRIHGVDHWGDGDFDNNIGDKDKQRLQNYKPPDYEQRNFWKYWSDEGQYERSSSGLYRGIFCTLFTLWIIVWFAGSTLLFYNAYYTAGYITTIITAITFLSVILKGANT